jgi:hypothetical protein
MARARTIKPQFLNSRSMRAVSTMARFTFLQLLLLADDAGRLVVYPTLAGRLFPDDAEAAALFQGWLAELEGQHCIERYTVEGLPYLRIVNWHRHQKIYHPTPSRLPPRPAGFRKESGAARESLGSESEKPSGDRTLATARQIPERLTSLANRSGKSAQAVAPPGSSANFGSDSRGEAFLRRVAAVLTGGRKPATPSAAATGPTVSPAASPAPAGGRHSR